MPNLKLLHRMRSHFIGRVQATADDSLLLLGRMASWRVRSMEATASLAAVEFKVFSQWGEDGIIDWIVERAQIPPHLQSFIEFGVEFYGEAKHDFSFKTAIGGGS